MPSNDPIIIVSGLPRSGTSLMMMLLDVGGVPVLTDNVREADIDNPRGYYELERVKLIKEDSSFLVDAPGKVFKMISMLLFDLPSDIKYKILFMRRDIREILLSEKKMLDRLGKKEEIPDEQMSQIMSKHVNHVTGWLADQPNIEVCEVNYNNLMKDPKPVLREVISFLDLELNFLEMLTKIDQSLYRNRLSEGEN